MPGRYYLPGTLRIVVNFFAERAPYVPHFYFPLPSRIITPVGIYYLHIRIFIAAAAIIQYGYFAFSGRNFKASDDKNNYY